MVICDSIGIPYELLYKSDSESRQENLRRYSRYLRKLKNVQRCIAGGLKQLVFIHLANKGISFKRDDIEIDFFNTLANVDNLDKLEQADITISSLENMKSLFDELLDEESPYREFVRKDVFLAYMAKNLETVGLDGAVDLEALGKANGGSSYNTDNGNILKKMKVEPEPEEEPVQDEEPKQEPEQDKEDIEDEN